MRRLLVVLGAAVALLCGSTVVSVPGAVATNTLLTNPLGFSYRDMDQANVDLYGHPTGMVVAGRCNRYASEFATAQANGAEVLAYLAPSVLPNTIDCTLDSEFYTNTSLWPTPTPGTRTNGNGLRLTDMHMGSAWVDHVVSYVQGLMTEGKVDGVFLDIIGARLWGSQSHWDDTTGNLVWSQQEKTDWTQGNVDLVRRLDALRHAINPRFIIVNNNNWSGADAAGGRDGELYVDGICIEHHSINEAFAKSEAGRTFGDGSHRRVLVIALDTTEARAWASQVQGVTHVSDQQTYSHPTVPPVGFNRLTDRPKTFGRTDVAANPSGGMAANQKRGSKFTLADKATLLRLEAYLDADPTRTTGSQAVRLALYATDNNGLPGARLTQSGSFTVTAGQSGGWVSVAAPATVLNPGQYWIVIHTGDTQGIARNRGDGAANWYGNSDTFDDADGASNPFGSGTAGNVTLSVRAVYTVGF